uniref:Putative secreted protein n=1 Tax=Rhipicephalus microplus TaxID=6941 RepID=A0A6M2DD70_RHIMP
MLYYLFLNSMPFCLHSALYIFASTILTAACAFIICNHHRAMQSFCSCVLWDLRLYILLPVRSFYDMIIN